MSWLRDFTDLPLGVYPNLGHLTRGLWRFDERIDPEAYAELALEWREEGAQIIGGCCGVTPEHIAAAASRARRTRGRTPAGRSAARHRRRHAAGRRRELARRRRAARSTRSRSPISPSSRACSSRRRGATCSGSTCTAPGSAPAAACLDVGCGCGILAVQLALNGAALGPRDRHRPRLGREHARQRVPQRRRRTASRGDTIDLFQWEPTRAVRRDRGEPLPDARRSIRGAERPPPARLLGPQPLRPLPRASSRTCSHADGRALVLQLSILGQVRTAQLLAVARPRRRGWSTTASSRSARSSSRTRPRSRESRSSPTPHHLAVGGDNVMIAYLLEVAQTEAVRAARTSAVYRAQRTAGPAACRMRRLKRDELRQHGRRRPGPRRTSRRRRRRAGASRRAVGSRRRRTALLAVAEPTGDPAAHLVVDVDADLDPVGAAELDPDPRQRPGDGGRDSLPRRRRPEPSSRSRTRPPRPACAAPCRRAPSSRPAEKIP